MKKRLFLNILLFCLLLAAVAPAARATETAANEETTEEGTQAPERGEDECGDDLRWVTEGSTLYIIGTGSMDDYASYTDAPWYPYRNGITAIVIHGNVTAIGTSAFTDYDNLTSVDFGDALVSIGDKAFSSCDGLTSVTLPATFRSFGEESFMSCSKLTEFHFEGTMPRFNQNCLWNTYATLYFPVNNPWPLEHIIQLETAFQGRIEFLASDGSDPYTPTEPEETEEATEPATTEAVTEPETQPVTEPETTAPATEETLPTTEETAETTQETVETTEETVPETQAPEKKGGISVGLVIVIVVLGILGAGTLIFGMKGNRRGKYSR